MKIAHTFMTKEALSDLLFGPSAMVQIDDIMVMNNGNIFLSIISDNLPDECSETSTRQVRLQQIKDVHVDSEGKVHSKYTMEILMRDDESTNFGKTTYAKNKE